MAAANAARKVLHDVWRRPSASTGSFVGVDL